MNRFDYSQLSLEYDQKRYVGRKNLYIDFVYLNCLKSLLPRQKSISYLDVGCGTGRGVVYLTRYGKKIVGLDYTVEMLKICQNKLGEQSNVCLIRGDSHKLPFADESFDCVISLNFLHLFSHTIQKHFIDEMARVLKYGGVLIAEFDNLNGGLIAGRRSLKKSPSLVFNQHKDFKNIFDSHILKIEKIRGTALPYMWRFFQYAPNIFSFIEVIAYFRPFSLVAPRFMVKAQKVD